MSNESGFPLCAISDRVLVELVERICQHGVSHLIYCAALSDRLADDKALSEVGFSYTSLPSKYINQCSAIGDHMYSKYMDFYPENTVLDGKKIISALLVSDPRDFGLLRTFNVAMGVMIPTNMIHKHHTGYIYLLYCDLDRSKAQKYWERDKVKLTKLVASFDSGMRTHYLKNDIGLAPREVEVLEWLAAGLRPDRISHIMGIGYRTVDKYIVTAKKKLKARTRDSAIATAIAFNAIKP